MRGVLGGSGRSFPGRRNTCARSLGAEGVWHTVEAERRPKRLKLQGLGVGRGQFVLALSAKILTLFEGPFEAIAGI